MANGMEIASIFVSLGLEAHQFVKELDNATSAAKGFADKTGGFFKNVAAFAAGGLLVDGIKGITGAIAGYGSEALDAYATNERLGMSLESLLAKEIRNTTAVTEYVKAGQALVGLTKEEGKELDKLSGGMDDQIHKRDALAQKISIAEQELNKLESAENRNDIAIQKKRAALDDLRYKYNSVNDAISTNQARITELTGKQNQLVDVTKKQVNFTLDMSQALDKAKGPAKELQNWIEKLAIVSPFESQGIADAYQMGLSFNFVSNNAKGLAIGMEGVKQAQEQGIITNDRITTGLVDWAAAAGKGTAEIGGVMRALGQMNVTGKVTKGDLNQLTTAGLDWMGTLTKMGYTLDDVSDGVVSTDDFIQTLVQTIESDFGGAAERQSNTWSGLLNSLGDIKKIGLREFFAGTFKAIQPYVADFVGLFTEGNFIDSVRSWGDTVGQSIGGALETIKTFVTGFKDSMGNADSIIGKFIANFQEGMSPMDAFIEAIWDIAPQWVLDSLVTLRDTTTSLGDAFSYLFQRIQGWGIGVLFTQFEDGSSILGGFFELLGMSEETANTFATVIFSVVKGLTQLGTWGSQIAQAVLPLLAGAVQFLTDNFSTLWPILAAVGGVILAIMSPVTALVAAVILLGTAWANNWGGIQDKVTAVMAAVQPYLDQLSTILNAFITAILPELQRAWDTMVQVWKSEVSPALAELWASLQELWTSLGLGTGDTDLWSVAMGALKIILLLVIGAVKLLTPLIKLYADGVVFLIGVVKNVVEQFANFKRGIDAIFGAVNSLISKVKEMGNALMSVDIPDWLKPGSPTPFQLGLEGIGKAIDSLPPINFGLEGNAPAPVPVDNQGEAALPPMGGVTFNITGNNPQEIAAAVRSELERLYSQVRR